METISGNLQGLRARVQAAAEVAVKAGLQPVFDASQGLVPVDTDRLKGSGELHEPKTDGTVTTATISYGNSETVTEWHGVGYEIFVHTPGTKWYGGVPYLEQPLLDAKSSILITMSEAFRKALQ